MSAPQKEVRGGELFVQSPYNSIFVEGAHKLNGQWVKPHWVFDARDEARVDALIRTVYGDADDLCTLRITWTSSGRAPQAPITVHGRSIATAWGRDSGAKLAEGVILLQGGFDSGGSVKNWVTTVAQGTVVLVRDFPKVRAEQLCASTDKSMRAYAIEPEEKKTTLSAEAPSAEALLAERTSHLARIAEIDKILASMTGVSS